jgi:hypothetical protein
MGEGRDSEESLVMAGKSAACRELIAAAPGATTLLSAVRSVNPSVDIVSTYWNVRAACYAITMDGEFELLGERIAEQAAHLDAAMHQLLADLRKFDERGGWHVQGAMSCAHWLSWRVGWDLVTSRERVRVARKLGDFAVIDDALRRGEVSYSKARAMLRVATPANEALLLDHARLMTASQLEKLCRKYAIVQRHGEAPHPLNDEQRRYVRRRDTDDGMVKIEAVLHPEEAELIWTMLNHAATLLVRGPGASEADSRCARSESLSPDTGPRSSQSSLITVPPISNADSRPPDMRGLVLDEDMPG